MSAYTERVAADAKRLEGWRKLSFFDSAFSGVLETISQEPCTVLPPAGSVFAALDGLHPDAVRVVVLGQDPYPTPGHAHGLAFSVQEDVTPLPRSLSNIFKEMQDDLGAVPSTGNLSGWAGQGVLLLNAALTVRAGEAGSHAKIGWSTLTEEIVTLLASRDALVWILWGKHAQGHRAAIEAGSGADGLIIESAHPSPLSARRGFFGSKPFSRTNNHLKKHGIAPIDWTA